MLGAAPPQSVFRVALSRVKINGFAALDAAPAPEVRQSY